MIRRISERALGGLQGRLVHRRLGFAGRKLEQEDPLLVKPLPVGLSGGNLLLDFLVGDDALFRGVDQEHAAGLDAPFVGNLRRGYVEHAGFRRHDHHAALGDGVAKGAQAVAVEHATDLHAVGERDRGRAVPGLHQTRVILVEGALLRAHGLVLVPRLRDHHHHRVGQGSSAHHQRLKHVVEHGRVAAALIDHRMQVLDVVAEQRRREHAFARAHPVHVAAQGVDFPVVRNHSVRMCARPAWKGVGGKARVHERQRRHHRQLGQVGEERIELLGGKHALVHQRARRQADHVEEVALGDVALTHLLFRQAANQAQLALEPSHVHHAFAARDEDLADLRSRSHRALAKPDGIHRYVAPAQDLLSQLNHGALENLLTAGGVVAVLRQEHHSHPVLLRRWQQDPKRGRHVPQKGVGNLQHDSSPIPGVFLTSARATVSQVLQYLDAGPNDLV